MYYLHSCRFTLGKEKKGTVLFISSMGGFDELKALAGIADFEGQL